MGTLGFLCPRTSRQEEETLSCEEKMMPIGSRNRTAVNRMGVGTCDKLRWPKWAPLGTPLWNFKWEWQMQQPQPERVWMRPKELIAAGRGFKMNSRWRQWEPVLGPQSDIRDEDCSSCTNFPQILSFFSGREALHALEELSCSLHAQSRSVCHQGRCATGMERLSCGYLLEKGLAAQLWGVCWADSPQLLTLSGSATAFKLKSSFL